MPKSSAENPRPRLGTYVIQVEVTETDWPSNGPDSFSSTAEILAAYARELADRIDAGYHGRLKTGRLAVCLRTPHSRLGKLPTQPYPSA